jgi:alpha-ketoglutarate-dependent taurine dioxygenase
MVGWGSKIHSTCTVHPHTRSQSRHLFTHRAIETRDTRDWVLNWHNDGSFVVGTFLMSPTSYHSTSRKGGGTYFAQGAALDALPKEKQELWSGSHVANSNSNCCASSCGRASYIETKERMVTLGYDKRCSDREVTGNSDAEVRC